MDGDLAISQQARAVRARLGQVVDGLSLTSVLHVGPATAHYLAKDLGDAEVVVEILLDSLAHDTAARDALVRAGRAGLRLRHPARVALLGMGLAPSPTSDAEPEVPYLAHAFAHGTPLDVLLEQDGPLDLDSALRVADVVLSVVTHAHRRGFVHGPVELSKILFADTPRVGIEDGAVTVLDCGAVSAGVVRRPFADIDPRLTPETRKDLVAVGLVLYATLAGERVALVTPRRDRIVQAVEYACDTHPFGARVERLLGRYLLRLLGVAGVPFQSASEAWTELDRVRTLLAFADGLVESLSWPVWEPDDGSAAEAPEPSARVARTAAGLANIESGEHPVITVPPDSFVRPRAPTPRTTGGALELVLDDLEEHAG